ncbi:MAG: FAD-dependent oxidoreductase [Deltaproteobacteria bacterium]|nr:FAD-dependent oxidoreductase [Deltaproteobacteria bacterium]
MARQILFKSLKRIVSEALLQSSNTNCLSKQEAKYSRRDFLVQAATAAATMKSSLSLAGVLGSKRSQDEVVVVGAGVAGLVASYRLVLKGVQVQIFETNERLGGRILTQKKFNQDGMFCELGGELIDSDQQSIIGLCRELNVPLEDFRKSDSGFSKIYFSHGKIRSEKELQIAAKPLLKVMLKDMSLMRINGNYETPTYKSRMGPKVEALDRMTLVEYLQSKKDFIEGWLLDLVQEAYESEFGVAAEQQSAINLLALFEEDPNQTFKIYGASDESKRVVGGNSNLIEALEKRVLGKAKINLGHRLVKVVDKGQRFELTFKSFGKTKVVSADRVIMTIPFSILREVEGIDKLEFSPVKKKSIAELGYGTDSKLIIGFKERFWRKQNGEVPPSCGAVFGDFPTQCFWETSRLQKGSHGIVTALFGGEKGLNPKPNILEGTLTDFEKIYPGASAKVDGNRSFMQWPKLDYAKGSYSTPKAGQYTTIIGAAGEPELGARMLFAGEHCSVEKQGYMDGAVESGNTVAEQFLESRTRFISGK